MKGAVIASDATPDKNKLSTGTLTWSDIQNNASYSASSSGIGYSWGNGPLKDKDGNVITDPKTGKPVDNPANGYSYSPGVSVSGNADSTTKSAISPGTIEVRSNPNVDLSGLSRDPAGALNALEKIFDKKTVAEQQELARVFGEVGFKLVGDIALEQYKNAKTDEERKKWDEGGEYKVLLHTVFGGMMSSLSGNGFATGALSAGLNEQLSNIKDATIRQIVSFAIGAVAAKLVGGNAIAGGAVAVSATKNNFLSHWQQLEREKAVAAGDLKKVAYWDLIDEAQNQVCAQMNINYKAINWEDPKNAGLLQTISLQAQALEASPDFQKMFSSNAPTVDYSTLIAAGATAVVVAGVTLYYYGGNWVKVAGTGTITGTVWDKITPTASNLPGTAIPATFQLQTAQRVLYVNSNATKHMAENINRFGAEGSGTAEIRSQAMLSSFNSAVQQGMANLATSAPGRYFINVGGWELGINTETGVIYHALYR